MRPKIISLLAVSALALVGCSSAGPSTETEATAQAAQASPSSTVTATPKPSKTANPNAQVEKQFAEFAVSRAAAHGVSDVPKAKDTVKALHAFCEDDEKIEVSNAQVLNENLEVIAENTYCDMLK